MTKNSLSFAVLGLRNFRLLLLTRAFIGMALQAQAIIVGWQIYELTRSPFLLGLSGLVEAVPAIGCALISGHVVDSCQPRTIWRLCQAGAFLNTLLLFLCAGDFMGLAPFAKLAAIYFFVFMSGIIRSFAGPAVFSLRAEIVPRPQQAAATAWWTSTFHVATIAGPAVAGLIYGGYGVNAAWAFPLLLTAGALFMAFSLNIGLMTRAEEKRAAALQSIREGWRYILRNQVMLAVMALDMFAVLFGGAVAMLPAFAAEVVHVGSEGLGLLRAATAIGSVFVALYLAVRPMKRMPATRLLWVVAGFGVCIIGFGLSKIFWLSFVFLALSGAFDAVSMVIRGTIMQLLTPDNMRGRVSAVNSMFIFSSNEIGAFESGLAARLMGLVPSVVFGGAVMVLLSGLTAWLSPAFRATVVTENGDIETKPHR